MQRRQDTGNKRVGKHLCRRPCPFALPITTLPTVSRDLASRLARGGRAERVEGDQRHERFPLCQPWTHAVAIAAAGVSRLPA